MSKDDRDKLFRDASERAEKHASGFSRIPVKVPEGIKFYKPEAGISFLDILPYKVGKGNPHADPGAYHYERTFFMHRNVGPAQDMVTCLAKSFGKPCPVCEMRAVLAKDPDADEKTVKGMGWKERQLFWVRDRKNKDAGWQLFEYSYAGFGKLLDTRVKNDKELPEEDRQGWGKFAHPVKGKTLIVTWSEEDIGQDKPFIKATAIDLKERANPYSWDDVDALGCLDDMVVVLSYDKLKAKVTGETGKDDSDADEDEKPKKKRSDEDEEDEKPKKKSSDEDDEDRPAKKKSSDEDEEDERPKKKSSDEDEDEDRPKKKKSDEDEDDERPKKKSSEEDEDDEKPKKKRSLEDEDDEKPKKKASDEDEDEDRPKKKRSLEDEDDERPAKKKSSDEDEEDEKPKKKKSEDEDDDWPDEDDKKKSKGEDEDDERPKKKKADEDED